jgi:Domain of unknown function (DUF1876)
MKMAKTWHVDIYIGEDDGLTRAEARLRPQDEVTLVASGRARCNPTDTNVPEIGDELAVARALSELAHRLLHAAAEDIEQSTHQRAYLSR